jgi:S1-C subfamily serine protease
MNPFDTTPTDSQRDASTQTSWHAIADPPTPDATSAPGAASAPSDPSSQADASTPRRRGGRGIRTVLAACLLSAVLASASTTALLSVALGGSQPASAAPTANAVVAATRSDPGDITAVVAAARPSVVTITSSGISIRGMSPFSVPATGVGSGVILTANGYILTNKHVISGSESLTVALADGTEYPATVVKQLADNDLALIKINATGLTPAKIGDSATLEAGETAIAIGSPLGTYTETVTKGIISALGRDITVADEQTGRPVQLHNLIQTDAAINPGNSGGPLLDANGSVVGLSTAVAGNAEGLGFAIPISAASDLISLARGSAS